MGLFQAQLNSRQMDEYFKTIDLSLSEAESLFKLLDFEDTGTIDAEEFVMGCLRIHGSAKAIDLTTLMCTVHVMQKQWREHAIFVEEALQKLAPGRETTSSRSSMASAGALRPEQGRRASLPAAAAARDAATARRRTVDSQTLAAKFRVSSLVGGGERSGDAGTAEKQRRPGSVMQL